MTARKPPQPAKKRAPKKEMPPERIYLRCEDGTIKAWTGSVRYRGERDHILPWTTDGAFTYVLAPAKAKRGRKKT